MAVRSPQRLYSVSVGVDRFFTGAGVSHRSGAVLIKAGAVHRDTATTVLAALGSAARRLGLPDASQLLRSSPVIRLCTAGPQSTLLLRSGEPFGLVVAPELVDSSRRLLGAMELSRELVQPAPPNGAPDAPRRIRRAVTQLLGAGARTIGLHLGEEQFAAQAERDLREQVHREFPPHSLGALPLILAGEEPGDGAQARLVALALDAYVRRALSSHLESLRSALVAAGFTGSLLVASGDGLLLPSHELRPALSLLAPQHALRTLARYWLQRTGLSAGVALRLGTFTSEIAPVDREQRPQTSLDRLLEPAPGGTACTVQRRGGRFVLVRPDSHSGLGPASFGWGGRLPTLVDALLCAGYLGAESLGDVGHPLDLTLAREAIAALAGGGGSGIESMAAGILRDVVDDLAAAVRRRVKAEGIGDPDNLLVCGRTGGLLACAVAERLGLQHVYSMAGGGLVLTTGVAGMSPNTPGEEDMRPDAVQAALLSAAEDPTGGLPPTGSRRLYIEQAHAWRSYPVLRSQEPDAGSLVGPALVEVRDAVHWIPPGWQRSPAGPGILRLERR